MTVADLKQCLSFLDRPDLFRVYTPEEEAVIREARELASSGGNVDFRLGSKVMKIVDRVTK